MSQFVRTIIFLTIGLFLLYSLSKTIFDYRKKLSFYQQYKQDYEEKLKKNHQLKSAIIKSQDSRNVERTIRDRLNLTKQHEFVVIIPQPSPTPQLTPEAQKPANQQWIEVFF